MPPIVSFSKAPKLKAVTAIILVGEGGKLTEKGAALDKETKGAIAHFIKTSQNFTGKAGQVASLPGPQKFRFTRIVLLGMGKPEKLGIDEITAMGGRFHVSFSTLQTETAQFLADGFKSFKSVSADQAAAYFAAGFMLRSYGFDKYKTKTKDVKAKKSLKIEFVLDAATKAADIFKHQKAVAEGVFFARDLVNEPPNVLYPASMAGRVKAELAPLGIKVEVMDEKKMTEFGFKAHLAVGMGSIRPPRVVVLHWNGTKSATSKTIA